MKRRDILSLRVINLVDNKKLGFIKELMLKEDEFKLSHYIINDNTLENTYILPIEKAKFNEGNVVVSDISDMIKIDSLKFYNEMIRNETYFTEKNILEEGSKIIGKAIEYSFDVNSGELEEILYIDTEKGCISSVPKDRFVRNVDGGVIVNKKEVDIAPTLRTEDLGVYYSQLQNVADEYQNIVKEEYVKLNTRYLEIEKEMVKEFDSFIEYMKNKREDFFGAEVLKAQEEFTNMIDKKSEEAIIDMKKVDGKTYFEPRRPSEQKEVVNEKEEEIIEPKKESQSNVQSLSEIINKKMDSIDRFKKEKAEMKLKDEEEIEVEEISSSDKELQKLFELQRKRADIINKL